MKTILVTAALIFTVQAASAQKLTETEVPKAVKENFSKKYPAAKEVKWKKEGADFEAKFDMDKKELEAIFDAAGAFKMQEEEIKTAELPKGSAEYCTKNFPDYKLHEAEKKIDAAGAITYEAELKKEKEKKEILFDSNGKFLSEVKD